MGYGRVIGGDYKGATVSTPVGSTLVVQAGLKFRKLTPDNVEEWDDVVTDGTGNPIAKVGVAVAGATLPGRFGKAASAAVDATLDSINRSRVIRVNWADGKRSLIKLTDGMYKHLELVLEDQRATPAEPSPAELDVAPMPPEKPTVAEQAFTMVSGLIRDRLPVPKRSEETDRPATDVADLLERLAALRDSGVLTEEEFLSKKAELLDRL
ncbi:SHOCT domain-containing protein [Leifsonia sp. NPDC058194]|uniref:SHOCT domain-containing protein n=1 Tax=Leifsonia sp. NPDC058194 TaxID=3346374 RepID=UPI0036DE73F8